MKSIALAVIIATLTGCAIVPIGPPPIYVGIHAHGGYGYGGGGYYGGGRGYWGR
ncbi:MAG: hypothetical protein ABI277_01070 [Burkholderiaceae bacterium]